MTTVHCVIPAYQSAKTVERAIASAIDQTGVDVHVTVVDHGSSDDTPAIVAAMASRDNRIDLVRLERTPSERRSASRPLNEGIHRILSRAHEDGCFYFRLDSDDILVSNATFSTLLDGPFALWIIGEAAFIDSTGALATRYGLSTSSQNYGSLMAGAIYFLPHQSALVHHSLLQQIKYPNDSFYDVQLGYGEDLDLSMRLLSRTRSIRFVDYPVIFKYLGPGTITSDETNWRIVKDHVRLTLRYPRPLFKHLLRYASLTGLDLVANAARSIRTNIARPSPSTVSPSPCEFDASARMTQIATSITE